MALRHGNDKHGVIDIENVCFSRVSKEKRFGESAAARRAIAYATGWHVVVSTRAGWLVREGASAASARACAVGGGGRVAAGRAPAGASCGGLRGRSATGLPAPGPRPAHARPASSSPD